MLLRNKTDNKTGTEIRNVMTDWNLQRYLNIPGWMKKVEICQRYLGVAGGTLLLMGTMPMKPLELARNLLMIAFNYHRLVSSTGQAEPARWTVGRLAQ